MADKNKSWKTISFVGLIQVVASFTIILSVITLLGQHHRYIELFSHFKYQYFISSITCAVIFLFYKKYKFTMTLILVAALNFVFIAPWYIQKFETKLTNEYIDLTILHSNVLTSNVEFEEFINLVNQQNPDVFVMQEVNQNWLSNIQVLEKSYPYKHTMPREDNFGIALISKFPLISAKNHSSGAFDIPTILATILIKKQLVTIITSHPLPPVNYEYYQARNSQLNMIAELSKNIQGPLILVGDLNVSMWSHHYWPLEAETGLRNARKGFGILPTWPTQFLLPMLMIPIDHVLISSHFEVHDIKAGKDIGSDHLPLIVKLSIKTIE
jgi:endonuclease/exonuclease/phosphatase (EEP) superfamily protein YafD